jgi:predicted RNase H-like HicB family nuclease
MVEKMKSSKTYTARCERAGDWWAISVPELGGVHTQARRLEGVEAMVRDAIALFLNVRPDSFEVKIEPVLPRELQRKVGRVRKARDEAETLQRQATIGSAELAADLVHGAHLTVRDAGRVLGVSHQRVAQLLKAGGTRSRPGQHRHSPASRDSQADSRGGE